MLMDKKRVVITGMGTISPIGLTTEDYWKNCLAGKSGVDTITSFDPADFAVKIAAEVRDFDAESYFERVEARKMDRYVQFAVATSEMAVKDAALDLEKEDPTRMGTLVGSGVGGIATLEAQHSRLINRGPSRISPYFVPMMIIDMAPGMISMRLNLKGPNFGVVSACASGSHAFGETLHLMRMGKADLMISGGAEAAVTPMTVGGFASMKALSTRNDEPSKASRPFDKDRDGFVLGEGAGMMVFETLEHARERGARIYAEIIGYGATADAYHMTAPAPGGEGAARAMREALADAGLSPEEVSYINAHGTSTPHNDRLETEAIKTVFGEHAYKVPINSTKSMIGHLLGAGGALELQAGILSIRDGKIHPTVNHEVPDPDCDLDYVPGRSRDLEVDTVLSNSFGFGGHNASIIVKAFKE
jgi:3-oxoacyl-[acyl-carrier-protein] synthase II